MGLKALPKHSGEYLLEVIMRRYENRSTILDRFLHHAQVVAIKGRSYRVKDSPVMRAPKQKDPTASPAAVGDAS